MPPPKISVIIPCRNAAEFVEETIDSILGQSYPNLECIVVDGASTDGTVDILRRYDGRITWVSEKDDGQSAAINRGLGQATGDILAYLCADDTYEEGCLEKVADFFQRNPDIEWAYGKCRMIDKDGREIRRQITRCRNFVQARYSYNRLLLIDFIFQPAVFWRKRLFDELGPFEVDQHLVMDYEYWLRAGASYAPGFIDDCLAALRVHPKAKSSVSYVRQVREALGVARRYVDSPSRRLLIPLQCLTSCSVLLGLSLMKLVSHMRAALRGDGS